MRDLFSFDSAFQVVGRFETATQLWAETRTLSAHRESAPWDLVLMVIELPKVDGIEATARLRALWPQLDILMLAAFEDPQRILGAICAGASRYLLKQSDAAERLKEVRAVTHCGSPLTPSIARSILHVLQSGAPAPMHRDVQWDLSQREMDVLRGLVARQSYKQVAGEMEISLDTVRTHVRRIFGKMQVHSISEAVARTISAGII